MTDKKLENKFDEESIRNIWFERGNEVYIIRYRSGDEGLVIDGMAGWARNLKLKFDWFDAAMFSYTLGKKLETEL